MRVVVADDEEDVRILLSRILAEVGYDVYAASEGTEALAVIRERRPDLVVLDLMMPGIDGWDVLRQLRATPSPPRVVVLTARDDPASFARAIREGATAYVVKPFRFPELLATVQRAMTQAAPPPGPAAGVERRRDPRKVVMAQVKILTRDRSPIALGEILDVSAGGMRIHLGARLDVGDRVSVALHLPGAGPAAPIDGVVLWNAEGHRGFAHGLRLTDLTPEAEAQLAILLGR
jgi:DNA-binding response OmpR family regulator